MELQQPSWSRANSMTQSFSLRDAVPGDEALVLGFVRELAEYEKLLHEVHATEADFSAALFGPRPAIGALIVEQDGAPVGFAVWYFAFSTFHGARTLYVEDVFVRPALRGGGIGRAIFRHLAQHAVAQGCRRMAWMVLDWNAPSIGFYRGLGAQPVEGWTTYGLEGAALAALAD
jgi:GNAT superfamily N-acetyltransferase